MEKNKIYLATVALEKNRWGSRVPSFLVSDWLDAVRFSGFDGIELWENHAEKADISEVERIKASGVPVAVYNTYVGFSDEEAERRLHTAKMIHYFGAASVKYNVGNAMNQLDEYKKNLRAFAEMLDCELLCECHAGTVLADIDVAKRFFAELPQAKYGMIVHPFGEPSALRKLFEAFGGRIVHVHAQICRENGAYIRLDEWPERVNACFDMLETYGYSGGFTVEFTGKTATPDENIDTMFENAVLDKVFIKERLS